MPMVSLGFLEILQDIMTVIFEISFVPQMKLLFNILVPLGIDIVTKYLIDVFMELLAILLKMVDFMEDIFDIFSGVRYVHFNDGMQHVLQAPEQVYNSQLGKMVTLPAGKIVEYQQVYLTDMFISYGPVVQALAMLTLFAFGLSLIFTIFTVAKSISDMTLEGKNPVGKVLGRTLKAGATFLLVPVMTFVLIQLSTVVVVKTSDAINSMTGVDGAPPSMGTVIFLSGSLNATKDGVYNPYPSFTDTIRMPYYTGAKDYSKIKENVKQDFDITKYDIFQTVAVTLLVILIMICSIFLFVGRLFEVVMLYLVSPFFVCTMPFDDGAAFRKWQDLFVAKLFSGFGCVFTMKLFLALVPLISGPSIQFSTDPNINGVLKVFIIIGGAWAAFKSQHLLLQIMHPEAAMAAQASTAAVMGAVMGMAMGMKGMMGGKGGKMGGGKMGGGGQKSGGGNDQTATKMGMNGGKLDAAKPNDPQQFQGKR